MPLSSISFADILINESRARLGLDQHDKGFWEIEWH